MILVRESEDEKDTAREVRALRKVARQREWKVKEVCKEPFSGAPEAPLKGMDRVRELVENGKVAKVIVDEVSRIGRRNATALDFLHFLEQHKVSLYWDAQEAETLQANCKRSQKGALVFALLEEMAGAERQTIVDRTKAGPGRCSG